MKLKIGIKYKHRTKNYSIKTITHIGSNSVDITCIDTRGEESYYTADYFKKNYYNYIIEKLKNL